MIGAFTFVRKWPNALTLLPCWAGRREDIREGACVLIPLEGSDRASPKPNTNH
jgi:hypothetical protein